MRDGRAKALQFARWSPPTPCTLRGGRADYRFEGWLSSNVISAVLLVAGFFCQRPSDVQRRAQINLGLLFCTMIARKVWLTANSRIAGLKWECRWLWMGSDAHSRVQDIALGISRSGGAAKFAARSTLLQRFRPVSTAYSAGQNRGCPQYYERSERRCLAYSLCGDRNDPHWFNRFTTSSLVELIAARRPVAKSTGT